MQHMKQNGVSIDALQLNTLIRQLLFENKRDEAQVVIDVDFERVFISNKTSFYSI